MKIEVAVSIGTFNDIIYGTTYSKLSINGMKEDKPSLTKGFRSTPLPMGYTVRGEEWTENP